MMEEQASRAPMADDFTPPSRGELPFKFEVLQSAPYPRYWFLTENGDRLVQLQHDLIAQNWRRWPTGEGEYPRYEAPRQQLEEVVRTLQEVVQAEQHRQIAFNWCEVSHVNNIEPLGATGATL